MFGTAVHTVSHQWCGVAGWGVLSVVLGFIAMLWPDTQGDGDREARSLPRHPTRRAPELRAAVDRALDELDRSTAALAGRRAGCESEDEA
jgi:hypothetical protein